MKKDLKGKLVAFKNDKGEIKIGHAVLYYRVIVKGKHHWKEASQVTIVNEEDRKLL